MEVKLLYDLNHVSSVNDINGKDWMPRSKEA